MTARRFGAPGCRRSAALPPLRRAPVRRTNARARWCKESGTCSMMRSPPAAPRCAITSAPTASSACFSINSPSTTAKASAARGEAAAAPSGASCRAGGWPSSVRCASDDDPSLNLPLKGGGRAAPKSGILDLRLKWCRARAGPRSVRVGWGSRNKHRVRREAGPPTGAFGATLPLSGGGIRSRQRLVEPLVDHRRDLLAVLLLHHDVAVALDAAVGELDPGALDARLPQVLYGASLVGC